MSARRMGRWIGGVMCSLALLCGAAPASAQTLTRGPYLQSGTDTGVVVRWRTSATIGGRITYGTSLGVTDSTVVGPSTTEHELTLGGLLPDTRYYYSIWAGITMLAGGDTLHSFVTAPATGATTPLRMWVIGDSGLPLPSTVAVRDAYLGYAGTNATDVFMMLGDNAYDDGTDAEYQAAVFDMFPELLRSTVLWPTRGNHDRIHGGPNDDYYDFFTLPESNAGGSCTGTEAYYSFDWGNVHFVCLDSEGSDKSIGSCMLTWLEADLAATEQDWIVAFWHHTPYNGGLAAADEDMRENVLPILEEAGVDLVLTGHDHTYQRSMLLDEHYGGPATLVDSMKVDDGDGAVDGDGFYHKPTQGLAPHEGTVYAVVGSSSSATGGPLNHPAMISSLNELGSMVVDVDAFRLDGRFLDFTGVVRDSFTIVKSPTTQVSVATTGRPAVQLSPGWPNPFGRRTTLALTLPTAAPAKLTVLDVSGRRVRKLASGLHAAGRHAFEWNGRDDAGHQVPAGVYFAVLETGNTIRASKIVLAR